MSDDGPWMSQREFDRIVANVEKGYPMYRITVEDDHSGDVQSFTGLNTHNSGRVIYQTLVEMVTRPGNKREGDAVEIVFYVDNEVADRYSREADS